MARAVWQGVTVAETEDPVVVEGNPYFPPESVSEAVRLVPSSTTTFCAWKGTASYYTLETEVDGQTRRNVDAAWYYPEPKRAAQQIAGRLAFWKGVEVTG